MKRTTVVTLRSRYFSKIENERELKVQKWRMRFFLMLGERTFRAEMCYNPNCFPLHLCSQLYGKRELAF
uniref:Uncharacterized protein n=1 Tax=Anguilla anguilla TaxID=7936 RepID=A0A0E9X2Q6_ANGAN